MVEKAHNRSLSRGQRHQATNYRWPHGPLVSPVGRQSQDSRKETNRLIMGRPRAVADGIVPLSSATGRKVAHMLPPASPHLQTPEDFGSDGLVLREDWLSCSAHRCPKAESRADLSGGHQGHPRVLPGDSRCAHLASDLATGALAQCI